MRTTKLEKDRLRTHEKAVDPVECRITYLRIEPQEKTGDTTLIENRGIEGVVKDKGDDDLQDPRDGQPGHEPVDGPPGKLPYVVSADGCEDQAVAHGKTERQSHREGLVEQGELVGAEYGDVPLDDAYKERGQEDTDKPL